MARKKDRLATGVVLFDVYYEDGSRASNRKVPAADLGGLDGDAPALDFIIDQDREIASLSGRPARAIKTLVRAGKTPRAAKSFSQAGKPPRAAKALARASE